MSFYFDHIAQAYPMLAAHRGPIQCDEALPGWLLPATGCSMGTGPALQFAPGKVLFGDQSAPVSAVPEGSRPADSPLGAFVTESRYEEVLLERLQLGAGTVVTWSTIRPGAGPSEFGRLQEVEGAYTVCMVDAAKRTVGLHLGEPAVGQRVRPRVVRLVRAGEQWRHGVAFEPIS